MKRYLINATAGLLANISVIMLVVAEDIKKGTFPPGPPPPQMLFKVFDENLDGAITEAEVPVSVWTKLSNADANEDASVTKVELKAYIIGKLLEKLDLNDDQALAEDEVPVMLWQRLKEADTDKSGKVSVQEFTAFELKMDESVRAGPPPFNLLFSKFDINGDGALTAEELPEPIWLHLTEADENLDDAVTKLELFEMAAARPFEDFDKNLDGKITRNEVPALIWERMSQADMNGDGAVSTLEIRTGLSFIMRLKLND